MGGGPHEIREYLSQSVGEVSGSTPETRLWCRQIRQSEDWAYAEFPFLSFSNKLGAGV
jgi:hypothetical protein